jgi:acetyl-CoA carboxylase biotin carboxyl carrier protein
MTHASLTNDDVTQILRLVDELPDGELTLGKGDFTLSIRKGLVTAGAAAPAVPQSVRAADPAPAPAAPTPVAAPAGAVPAAVGSIGIRASMLGRFYRASSPGETPFVEVGSKVRQGDIVCVIEVMKLFNSVCTDISGTVVAIHVENDSMVEFDQLLISIQPD